MKPFDVAFMKDTPIEVQRQYYKMLRDAGPEKRLETCLRLSKLVREMALNGIRQAHPDLPWPEVRREYMRQILRPEEFMKFFPGSGHAG